MSDEQKKLTTNFGAPVPNNQDSVTAGPRGPMLLQDVWFLEKLANFDREVIPERRMHAKGSGAFGTFTVTNDITKYTRAKLFSTVGKKTDLFVRFSTVAGERGAADAERDIRGFAVKLYTEEGNWDLVGNNTPVFFFRDPLKFPDLNHAVKRDPRTNMRSAQNNWDFWSSLPEALHQVTIVMSDHGIPASYRHMHGFGSHTFSLINAAGERNWVKFHWVCQQGIKTLTDQEAAEIVGNDRESHQRDLYEAIENKDFPRWKLCIQVMPEKDAATYKFHPFDLTKVWLHGDYPLIEVGDDGAQQEPGELLRRRGAGRVQPGQRGAGHRLLAGQDAPGPPLLLRGRPALPPGREPSPHPGEPGPLPGARLQPRRLMRVDGNYGSTLHYEPNSYGEWQEQPEFTEPPLALEGAAARWDYRAGRQRLLHPTGPAVPPHRRREAAGAVREHGPEHGPGDEGRADPAHQELPQGRPGLRRRSGRRAGHPDERDRRVARPQQITSRPTVRLEPGWRAATLARAYCSVSAWTRPST